MITFSEYREIIKKDVTLTARELARILSEMEN